MSDEHILKILTLYTSTGYLHCLLLEPGSNPIWLLNV